MHKGLVFLLIFLFSCSKNKEIVVLYKINKDKIPTIYNSMLEPHGIFVKNLKDDNILIKAGPLNDSIGLAIFHSDNKESLFLKLNEDPAIKNDLLEIVIFEDWEVLIE